jgi:KUP system potassium uptake protein
VTDGPVDRSAAAASGSDEGGAGSEAHAGPAHGRYLLLMSLTALGIVYGDIGTSPLYALRESFRGVYNVVVGPESVLGVLSLIFWSLVLVISVKYLGVILRADNRGEGGILALTSLVTPVGATRGGRWWLIMLGLFGAALLYGDSMITPAISVLSAVEGLQVATPVFQPYVIPITVVILVLLFAFQRRGTAGVGSVFGPVTVVWFTVLAVLGIRQIVMQPSVLRALNPMYAAEFFGRHGVSGVAVLGSVFLVVTGGEALYADMGHFGKRPIRLAWFTLVLPALLLNYFGQGALLIRHPDAIENPFYHMGPDWALYPLVVLATAATVIASQAVISGAFSLTMQAVQLGYSPRMEIQHTSAKEMGQIYIPGVNWTLMIATLALVFGFGSASALAAAYGVAVTTTMVITTVLFFVLARERWRWPLPVALLVAAFFMTFDLAFWLANLTKIPDGGWFPLLVGGSVFTILTTWKRGRQILRQRLRSRALPIEEFLARDPAEDVVRVPGTAVFMNSNPETTPPALLHNLKHNRVLHEHVVLLAVETEEVPRVTHAEQADVKELGQGFYSVLLRFGFMQDVDVPAALARLKGIDLEFRPMETTYFLGRETLLATEKKGMAIWRERLFAFLSRNARSATSFFHLPPNRVVELGAQVEL